MTTAPGHFHITRCDRSMMDATMDTIIATYRISKEQRSLGSTSTSIITEVHRHDISYQYICIECIFFLLSQANARLQVHHRGCLIHGIHKLFIRKYESSHLHPSRVWSWHRSVRKQPSAMQRECSSEATNTTNVRCIRK